MKIDFIHGNYIANLSFKHNFADEFSELPLETWTELFGFVPRSQLKQLVPHIGETHGQTIGDRQFVSFIQFFLHKCGEITFIRLCIYRNKNEPMIWDGKNWELRLADLPMPIPDNFKNFNSILIINFDESVAAFLQQFQRNSLLTDVNLHFNDCLGFLPQIMTKFMPLFTNINSILINNMAVLDKLQSDYSQLAIPMFASARVLIADYFDYNHRDAWFCDWLHTPREDGKPRILFLINWYNFFRDGDRSFSHFIEHIKKDFLEANQAVSFFVKLKIFGAAASVQSLTLENSQTREKLVIKAATFLDPSTISRYPVGINQEGWIEEMSHHLNMDNRKIEFDA